jgi:hypothetical protein
MPWLLVLGRCVLGRPAGRFYTCIRVLTSVDFSPPLTHEHRHRLATACKIWRDNLVIGLARCLVHDCTAHWREEDRLQSISGLDRGANTEICKSGATQSARPAPKSL